MNNEKIVQATQGDMTDVIDVEVYGKKGEVPPKGDKYKIKVDKEFFIVESNLITGKEVLELAGKNPLDRYRLDLKLHGGATKKVELSDIVDLTEPGIEKFLTLPLDQTEGSYE